jgi:Flp pilus assembly CpaE family ATPase
MAIEQTHLIDEKVDALSSDDFIEMVRLRNNLLVIAKMIRRVIIEDDPKARVEEIIADLSQTVRLDDSRQRFSSSSGVVILTDEEANWLRGEACKWSS